MSNGANIDDKINKVEETTIITFQIISFLNLNFFLFSSIFIIIITGIAIILNMYQSKRNEFRQNQLKQWIAKRLILFLLGFFALSFLFAFIIFAWYARDLPSPGKLSQVTGNSTVFYDRDGKILFDMYKDKNRMPVPISDVSKYLKDATVAIEDKTFYKHKGISETGIIRSLLSIVFRGRLEGGSTITQQLIKNVLLDSSRRISRKIKELILAFEVERKYSKDQILEMYLNEAPYGGNFWGVGSAAKGYFDKEPKNLNLVESAILAGLPQSPTYYSPFIGKNDAWRTRAKDVLRRMREDGYIKRDEEKAALKKLEAIKFTSPNLAISAPHFVFYVKDLIEEEYSSKLVEQGIKVKTTLSLEVQTKVEKIVKEEIAKIKNLNVGNGAVVVLDSQTGDILAMVGSYDYNNNDYGKFNASLGLRQPGSAIKPITYTVAFEKGYTPATLVMDLRTVFPKQGETDYIPENYDAKFRGPMQLRFALGNSENIPAVKLVAMIGVKDLLQKASDMGLTSLAPTEANLRRFGLAVTLGGGETTLVDLTSAFSVFASGGTKKDVNSFSEISDYKGKTLYRQVKNKQQRVVSAEVSYLISHILSDNNARIEAFGPNSYLNVPGKTVAVKTGTTNDKRDNWAIGFTKSVTVGVWVGNNDNSPMNPKIASGTTGASPIWYRIMNELLKKYSDGIMDKPGNVKAAAIDSYLGGLPHEAVSTRSEYFVEGTEPKDLSPFYKKLKISKSTGKLANDVEIKSGNYEEKEFIVITENDPVSTDGKNRWQEAINEWAKSQGDQKYHPPTEVSDSSADSILVSVKSPGDKTTVTSNNVEVKVKIVSISPVKNAKIYINGSEVKNYDGNTKEIIETFDLSDGTYEIRALAVNDKDKTGDSIVKIGVNKPWDESPTPSQTPTPTP